jgi:hypothetical protein
MDPLPLVRVLRSAVCFKYEETEIIKYSDRYPDTRRISAGVHGGVVEWAVVGLLSSRLWKY